MPDTRPLPHPGRPHHPCELGAATLVLAATRRELAPLLARLEDRRAAPGDAACGLLGGQEVVAATTGAGKANAAGATARWLARGRPARVVNLGCAGAFPGRGARVGDVVVGDVAVFADEGVVTDDGFLDLEAIDLPLHRSDDGEPLFNRIPTLGRALDPGALCTGDGFAVHLGPIATVSSVSGSRAQSDLMVRRWNPLAEAMEGAAVALEAARAGVPFIEVRGISNLTGPRDRASWEIDLACRNAAAVLARLLAATTHSQKQR